MILEIIFEVLFWLIVRSIPIIFRRLGAAIRWMYFRKERSYREVLKMKGNLVVGLCVPGIIVVIYILYLAAN